MNAQETPDFEDDLKKQHSSNRRNLLITLVILVAFTIWSFSSGNSEVGFQWSDESVTVICPDETEFSMNYSDITSLELLAVSDFGTCISGKDNRNTRYGIWENDEWGTYDLYALKDVEDCIVMQSADSVLVINYESDSVTSTLFEDIQNYCAAS